MNNPPLFLIGEILRANFNDAIGKYLLMFRDDESCAALEEHWGLIYWHSEHELYIYDPDGLEDSITVEMLKDAVFFLETLNKQLKEEMNNNPVN
ncbi:hypothetical protein [Tellurirhabdus bombi]|uniref:hypothetical protein n=1 Tax=Tellurirhabdus bombi TaxID=2907205 RepID=UPI001F38CDE3|nr:hypothetical protein [Tellurirhabdus bombi]